MIAVKGSIGTPAAAARVTSNIRFERRHVRGVVCTSVPGLEAVIRARRCLFIGSWARRRHSCPPDCDRPWRSCVSNRRNSQQQRCGIAELDTRLPTSPGVQSRGRRTVYGVFGVARTRAASLASHTCMRNLAIDSRIPVRSSALNFVKHQARTSSTPYGSTGVTEHRVSLDRTSCTSARNVRSVTQRTFDRIRGGRQYPRTCRRAVLAALMPANVGCNLSHLLAG